MEVLKKQEKKPTNAQLQNRINSAIVFVQKDKDTKSIFFDDKGLRLTATMDYAIVATNFHQHVFNAVNANGYSRPYLYVKRFIDIALENDCIIKDKKGNASYSYAKLFDTLKKKEDQRDYNIAFVVDMWLFNIFSNLYSIDETTTSLGIVWEEYMHNIAKNQVILDEHKEGLTNVQYVNSILDLEKSFLEGIKEETLFEAISDEERMKQEMEALQQQEAENVINAQADEQ